MVHPDAAGIAVHSEFHFVAVPAGRDKQCVRRFGAFTEDLERLADWLAPCGVRSVAMESPIASLGWPRVRLLFGAKQQDTPPFSFLHPNTTFNNISR